MINKKDVEAVLNVLHASIENRLNASLTPQDCMLLLTFIKDIMRSHKDVSKPRWAKALSDFAEGILDDLIAPGPPPGGKPR